LVNHEWFAYLGYQHCWNFLLDVIVRERNGQGWLQGALPTVTTLADMQMALE
jgi:hypothetical protein